MKSTFPFLIQCHRFYFYFLPTLLHILHFSLASSLNLRLFFFSPLSQCLYLLSSYIITYSAFLSSSFIMKSALSFFLLLLGIYICFLSPHTTQFTFNLLLNHQVRISFFLLFLPPFFLPTKSQRLRLLLLDVKWEWLRETYYRNMDLSSRPLFGCTPAKFRGKGCTRSWQHFVSTVCFSCNSNRSHQLLMWWTY